MVSGLQQDELFRKTFGENDGRIHRICRHFFNSKAEADDAYQDILLKIWLNIKSFRGEAQLGTWVNRIAVNTCLTYLSKANRSSLLEVPIPEGGVTENPQDESQEDDDSDVKLRFFDEFRSSLGKTDRMLVTLYLEDTEYREIAEITGLTEGNARARIHRIKKQIRKEWEEKYGT
jgi:RNA polymerase sigma-70 factor (ECF subfamily)